MPRIGYEAPLFTLEGVVGRGDFTRVSLADLRGQWVCLFFYPQDFTVVCPTELDALARRVAEFKKLNCAVLGCSVDSKHAHKAWITSTLGELPYPVLSDPTHEVADLYGALIRAKGYSARATFLIDPAGVLQYAVYQNDTVGRSVKETLRVLDALQTGENVPAEWKRGESTLGPPRQP